MMRTSPGVPDPSRGCHQVTPTQHAASIDAGPTPVAEPMTSATLPRSQPGPRQRAAGLGGAAGGAVGLGSAADRPTRCGAKRKPVRRVQPGPVWERSGQAVTTQAQPGW